MLHRKRIIVALRKIKRRITTHLKTKCSSPMMKDAWRMQVHTVLARMIFHSASAILMGSMAGVARAMRE